MKSLKTRWDPLEFIEKTYRLPIGFIAFPGKCAQMEPGGLHWGEFGAPKLQTVPGSCISSPGGDQDLHFAILLLAPAVGQQPAWPENS